ncbi:MAG: DUF981 domain-containing protein [Thermoplasmatales archaeon]|nr:DUF981 domain-containing protein [Thermoplasmatales archaeon]MCW6170007.1 DUF981 domain-containing protein [Thermoplasmatales archaeon]
MTLYVDSLAVMLIGLAMGTFLGAFYFFFKARGNDQQVRNLIIPAIAIGFFDFVSGYEMSFTWPLPSGYNMLFGDPLLLFGLLLIASAVMIYKNMNLGLLPLLFVLLGIYVLVGAYSINELGLEGKAFVSDNWFTSMGLYISDGIGALLAPILYLKPVGSGKYLYYIEWIILGIGTVFALVIGFIALNGHLIDFAHYFP